MKLKLLFITIALLGFGESWGQITEGFESSTIPASGWVYNSITHETTNFRSGSRCAGFNGNNDAIITPLIANPDALSFWWKRSGTAPISPVFTIQYGTSVTGPWTNVTTGSTNPITSFTTTYQEFIADLSSLSNVYIRVLHTRSSGANIVYIDDFSITAVSAITSTTSGNWSSTSTWVGGVVPTSATNAIIANGHVVTMDSNTYSTRNSGTTTTVNAGGTLATSLAYINDGTTTINGTFQINTGGFGGGANDFVYGANANLIYNHNSGIFYGPIDGNHKYWPSSNSPTNVTVNTNSPINLNISRTVSGLFQIADGVILTSANLTLNGTAQINAGGYFNQSPIFGNSSTLKYNTANTFGRGLEWSHNGVGTIGTTPGYPNHVQLSNNTTLNYNNGTPLNKAAAGNLTIDSGSSFYMDYGGGASGGSLTVAGNVVINGNFTLGNAVGDDLIVGGSWTRAGSFNPNSRLVTFNGSATQTITGATTFDYLTINNASNVTLASPVTNNFTLDFTNGKLVLGSNNFTIGSGGTITNPTLARYVVTNGTGKLIKVGVGNVATVFPIGFTTSNYTPITLTNTSGTSDLSVGVKQTITNAVSDPTKIVTLEWGITSSANTTATITPNWINATPINQAISFTNTGTGELGNYTTNYTTYPVTLSTTTTTRAGVALQNGTNLIVVGNTGALNSPFLAITGTTAHGPICPNTAATSQTYTITNTGRTAATGVTVVSNDPQFVVSALSSTTIAANGGTATYVVTFTPTSAGIKNAIITVASSTSGSNSPTSSLTGTGAVTIVPISTTSAATAIGVNGATLEASAPTFGVCPNTTVKGFVISQTGTNATPTIGGSGVTNEIVTPLGTQIAYTKPVTGLAEATTYSFRSYLYDGTAYTYGAVLTFTTAFSGSLNTVTVTKACLADDAGTISWTAPVGGVTPTGYMVFAVTGATTPSGTPTTALTDYANANTNFASATNSVLPVGLGKLLYKGNATSVDITGLTENTNYSFLVLSYQDGTSIRRFTSAAAGGRALDVTAQDDVKTFTGTPSNNQVTLNWTHNGLTNCFDEVMIVANQGAVLFTPSGDGSAYTANDVYASPNQVVYKGTANSKAITGFINGIEYCFKIYVRRGTSWSDGTSICATPDVTYCPNSSNNTGENGITNVTLNTINNSSVATPSYSDFTSVNTNLIKGENYQLSVKVKTYNANTSYIKAWIDWNKNGTFDSSEEYDLGTAISVTDGLTTSSPLNIAVPTTATTGNVRMRVISKQDSAPTACTSFNFGEVEDYTIIISQPLNAEINVKGGAISIPNGFDSPYGLNNTLFATTPLNTDSLEKEFTIENIGIADLNLSGFPVIKIEGANPLDFIVTQHATTPVINGMTVTFKIKFRPTVAGLRTANVRIESNDSDENPFIFAIEGTGNCTVAPSITVFPISGPRNTLVTFSSITSNLTGATVTYNNATVPISYNTTDKIEVLVPNDANDGNFEILLATGCSKIQSFDLIDSDLTNCEASGVGGTNATDLLIYEAYDENGGSGGVITIYNRTGVAVDLSSYSIRRAPNYGGTYVTTANLSGTIANGAVAVIGVSSSLCGYASTGNGSFGVTGFNGNDGFRLMKGTTIIDDVRAPNYVGYYLKRKNTNLNPNTTFNGSEWTDQSLASGQCLSGVATLPLIKFSPTVTLHPDYLVNCGITGTSLTVDGTEGFSGGLTLTYQWYVIGISGSWTAVVNGGIYSGATSTTLSISNIAGLDDYQYYCQIRESTATCYTATKATLIRISKKTWNGITWSGDGLPPISTQKAIIDGDLTLPYAIGPTTYDKLEACECQVNNGKKLIVGNSTGTTPATLMIQGAFVNNGEVTIHNNSSLVQVNDDAINTGTYTGTKFEVKRNYTAGQYDYVYWGAPTALFPVASLPTSHKYQWNTTFDNTNGTQGNWVSPTTEMTPGIGYIARASNGSSTPILNSFSFTGKPNNGLITVPISRGNYNGDGITTGLDYDAEPLNTNNLDTTRWDDNWNLLGNPYPSAINVLDFLTANTNIEGFVNIWTHSTPPNSDTDPYYQDFKYNYSEDDYIAFNGTGIESGPTGLVFDGFLASGQGFFVLMEDGAPINGNVFFNNAMRRDVLNNLSYINNQFYRNSNNNKPQKHRIWFDLITEKGQLDRTLVGYVQDATNKKDRLYDAVTKISGLKLYTFTNDLPLQPLGIQGKQLPFDNEDVVRLGYSANANGNYKIAIASVDGLFDSRDQNIYLEDKLLGSIHDLRATPYEFTSLKGRFDDRFFVRYNRNNLNIDDFTMANPLVITTNESKITIISKAEAFNRVQIFDLLGRKIYDKKTMDSNEYTISDLVQDQVLIVKVKLQNGNEISNKIIVK